MLSPVSFFWGGAITDHIGAFAQVTLQRAAAGGFRHGSVRSYLDLGQHRCPLCRLGEVRRLQCHLRHHGEQQSHSSGPLEYDAGLGVPLRGVDLRCTGSDPPLSSTAHLRRTSSAPAATSFINNALYLEASVYTTLSPEHSERSRHRSIWRTRAYSALRPIGARPTNPIGATIGSRSELSACTHRSIPGRCQEHDDHDFPADRQLHRHRLRYAVSVSGQQFLDHAARQLNSRIPKAECKLRQRHFRQPDQHSQRSARVCLARLRQQQPRRTHRPIFHQLGQPRMRCLYGGSPNTNGWIAEIAYIPFISSQRRDGRGSTPASDCNTPITPNSTEPPSAPAPTTRCFSTCGWRCSGIADIGGLHESNTARRRRAVVVDRLGIWRRSRTRHAVQGAAGASALRLDRLLARRARRRRLGSKTISDPGSGRTSFRAPSDRGYHGQRQPISGYIARRTNRMRLPVCSHLGGRHRGRRLGWQYRKGSTSVGLPLGLPGEAASVTGAMDLLTSLTARFGYAADRWLFYVKGGVAWASDSYSATGTFAGRRSIMRPRLAFRLDRRRRRRMGMLRTCGRSSSNTTTTASATAA